MKFLAQRGPIASALWALLAACDDTLLVGRTGGTAGATSNAICLPSRCGGATLACGDCLDNDADGLVDAADPDCLNACQPSEANFLDAKIMEANRCAQDCYFDGDLGPGNDGCQWPLECDPLRDAQNARGKCSYDPSFIVKVGARDLTCAELSATQEPGCVLSCLPLTPNGCDCFGCCKPPGLDHAVWLGSQDDAGNPTCSAATLGDPALCRPCTQVPSCLNTCDACEVCVGRATPTANCDPQTRCTNGRPPCGQPGDASCPNGNYCVSGCCVDTSASSLGK
ncbi:MAG: hypothetical protein SFV15_11325 [Polyangiaceae bacterium]|nr:hypothetical protein [Polyangiaceae bacterium]